MPRFLRPNAAIVGLSEFDGSSVDSGLRTPARSSEGLIVPQCITWPFSTDDAGVSFPAGTVGIRSVAPDRNTERAWATPGDPLENQDEWIAVPDTLPGGYTARPGRDYGRGPYGSTSSRGTSYLKIGRNGLGESASASFNYSIPGGANAARSLADWTVNGMSPDTVDDLMPSYRPQGGGGIVPLTQFPINVSKQVLTTQYYEASGGVPLPGVSATVTGMPNLNGGMALWTKPGLGFRAATWRYTALADDALWADAANVLRIQFIIGHNAAWTETGYGDTNDYASAIFTKSDFTTGAEIVPGFRYRWIEHTSTSGVSASVMRQWVVGYVCNLSSAWAGNYSNSDQPDYLKRVRLSPRVDIPPWFSVYGAGVGAPGGV